MARCATCHRRLKSGQGCPQHGGAIATETIERGELPVWTEPIGDCVGAGGFASVWELGGSRVLKVAHASHELARARMRREADALAAVGAPAVPRLDATGVLGDGRPFLAMARVSGATLSELATHGPMRARDALDLAIAALAALARIHAAGFAHRDVKPDNLVRLADGGVVVIDLGLARKLPDDPDDPTRANVQVGSLEYIAPEQIVDSAAADARSDLYALGCVLFELIAGRPPFVGDAAALERAHAALRPPRLATLANVPAAIETIVADCLAKDPARRPESALALRARLVEARDEPTGSRARHSMSMLREGKQPVVLLWAELPRVDRALLGVLTARRFVVVSQRGRRVLAGVLGGEHADPASVAVAAARDLAAAGARVALHLDALRVGASTIAGASVERPETWLPSATWSGVVVSRALAGVVHAPTRPWGDSSDFVALADATAPIELFGRDALLVDLAADAAVALAGSGPAFALVVGDAGVGKTALAVELARRIAELGARCAVATIPAPGIGRGARAVIGEALGVSIASDGSPASPALEAIVPSSPRRGGSTVRALGDALRDAARAAPLALVLDDLHLADHDVLDALEYATLGGEPLPLWVLGVASPRLDGRRPDLGARAERRRRDVLAPLDDDAALALAAALLRPAEYPPLRALRRLVSIARGNPLHLAMLAREMRERGAIRARAGGGHFLDTSTLDDLEPIALGPWLAARELGGLSPELVALARLCAVVGGEIRRDELAAIVEAVERGGGATTTIDVDIGLGELARLGVLATTDRGWMFAQSLVEEGVYATTHEDERRALHAAALEHWRGHALADRDVAERVARHAEAIGARDEAAAAFAALGDAAEREHRYLDADQAWSGAVRTLDEGIARAHAQLGRARARYRLQRMRDALVDLDDAERIAHAAGDLALELEVLVEHATVLDFVEDFAASKAMLERARARAGAAEIDRGIALDLDLAEARSTFREQRLDDAAARLRATLAAARTIDRYETSTIAGLLLGPILADLHELDEAELVYAELIARCRAEDDKFHLAAAYGNRAVLSSARGDIERTADDLRIVIQLAREAGQAHFERVATYNLAEERLWQGALDEALQLARRSLALQSRAGEGSTHPDRLLVARVLAARGDVAELAELLPALAGDASPDDRVTLAILRCCADGGDWTAALDELERLPVQLRLELTWLAARRGQLPATQRDVAIALADKHPTWRRRLVEL